MKTGLIITYIEREKITEKDDIDRERENRVQIFLRKLKERKLKEKGEISK